MNLSTAVNTAKRSDKKLNSNLEVGNYVTATTPMFVKIDRVLVELVNQTKRGE
jgi:hypothetical protein